MLLLAIVAVVALAASACSSSSTSGDAIVVNGTALSNADFQKRLDLIAGNDEYVARALQASGADQASTSSAPACFDPSGDTAGTYSTDFTTQVLNQQVTFVLAHDEVAKRGLTVSDEDRASAESRIASDLGSTKQCGDTSAGSSTTPDTAAGQATLDALGDFKPVLVQGVADIFKIQEDITTSLSTDEALQKAFDASGDTYKNQACVDALVFVPGTGPTQDPTTGAVVPPPESDYPAALDRANAVAAQLQAGGDITTLEAQSDNAKLGITGGDLGCHTLGSYAQQAPPLDAAIASQEVGKVGAPVKTDYGYFLLVVRSRGDLTFEEAKDDLKKGVSTAVTAAFRDWVGQATKDASVTVDPKWGSWDASTGTVVAPESATSSTTSSVDSSTTTDPLAGLEGSSSTTATP